VTFFDTNILVYATIDQGTEKLVLSEKRIEESIREGSFFISPLVLSEYIFILSKLKVLQEHHEDVVFYSNFVVGAIDSQITTQAYTLCKKLSFCKHINDAIHLQMAQKHCTKLLTFDSDFRRFEKFSEIEIEIL
jgi:predicted nucleic acid-binding protein